MQIGGRKHAQCEPLSRDWKEPESNLSRSVLARMAVGTHVDEQPASQFCRASLALIQLRRTWQVD